MPTKPSERPFLDFKYKRNRMIYIGGNLYPIKCDMRYQSTPFGKYEPGMVPDETKHALLPYFEMEQIHRVPLRDERPRIPKRAPGMSEAYHSKLCDDAYRRAAEAKVFNDKLREEIYSHAETGNIEIICDPFAGEEEVEGLADLADAVRSEMESAAAAEAARESEVLAAAQAADAQAATAVAEAETKIKAKQAKQKPD